MLQNVAYFGEILEKGKKAVDVTSAIIGGSAVLAVAGTIYGVKKGSKAISGHFKEVSQKVKNMKNKINSKVEELEENDKKK